MLAVNVNYFAVLLATASCMLVGAGWYSRPFFGRRWASLAKLDMDATGSQPLVPILLAAVLSFLTAWALAVSAWIAWVAIGGSFLIVTLVVAAAASLCFTSARIITHDLFERRPFQLSAITISYELVTALVMALLIGIWPPAI